jgi:hypothetical protein
MSMQEARKWAKQAEAGEYLAEYETDVPDSGSQCGFGDDELDEIASILRQRDLRLVADDRGLVATHRWAERWAE